MRVTSTKHSLSSLAVSIVCQGRREKEGGKKNEWKKRGSRRAERGKRGKSRGRRPSRRSCPWNSSYRSAMIASFNERRGAASTAATPTFLPSVSLGNLEAFRVSSAGRLRQASCSFFFFSAFDSSGLEGGNAAYLHLLPLSATHMHINRCKRINTRRFHPRRAGASLTFMIISSYFSPLLRALLFHSCSRGPTRTWQSSRAR